MSDEEKTYSQSDVEFLGAITSAMVKQSQWSQNAVEQNYIHEIEELRQNYIHLYRRLEKIQDAAQRLDIDRVLADHYYSYAQAQQPGWWSEDFNKNF